MKVIEWIKINSSQLAEISQNSNVRFSAWLPGAHLVRNKINSLRNIINSNLMIKDQAKVLTKHESKRAVYADSRKFMQSQE